MDTRDCILVVGKIQPSQWRLSEIPVAGLFSHVGEVYMRVYPANDDNDTPELFYRVVRMATGRYWDMHVDTIVAPVRGVLSVDA